MQGSLNTEILERRLCLAAFASLSSTGTLNVLGRSGDDEIRVEKTGGQIRVSRNSESLSFSASTVRRVWVNAASGNDRITNLTQLRSTLSGGGGDDTLRGGAAGDVLNGEGGIDTVDYSASSRSVQFHIGIVSSDDFPGGFRRAQATHGTSVDDLTRIEKYLGSRFSDEFDVSVFFDDEYTEHDFESFDTSPELFGSTGDDLFKLIDTSSISGSSFFASAFGGGGNDFFTYGEGASVDVFGENGSDTFQNFDNDGHPFTLDGGRGFDKVLDISGLGGAAMGRNTEYLYASGSISHVTGNDLDNEIIIAHSPALVSVFGHAGNDSIIFVEGEEHPSQPIIIDAGDGDDTVFDSGADALIIGGAGNDSIRGNSGRDTLQGNAGRDSLDGGAGDDLLFGGSGNDTLIGGAGYDLLHGQVGNDRILAVDQMRDKIDGGPGFDRASLDLIDEHAGIEAMI